jgi:AraC-like DNA-binding protein
LEIAIFMKSIANLTFVCYTEKKEVLQMVRFTDYSADLNQIVNCGHSLQSHPLATRDQYSRHFHDNYELLLLIKGDVHYSVDGNRYVLRPYDVLLIPPTKYHFLIPMSDEDYESYVINLKIAADQNERLQKLFSPPYILNISNDKTVRRMFEMLDYYFNEFSLEDFKEASWHLVNELLICLSYKTKDELDNKQEIETDSLITKITAYINENIEKELNARVIAREVNFSESYVQNHFSKMMGIGLKQYINQKKIYAANMDIKNGLSPNAAAQKYSFVDYSSFFRHYKKTFGSSPLEGRKA